MSLNAAAHCPEPQEEPQQEPLIGLAALMRMGFAGVDLGPLGTQLIARAERNPGDANALMDLSALLQIKFEPELALAAQAQALAMQQLYRLPAASGQAVIRLLAIMGPGDLMQNAPLEFLLEQSDVSLDMLYLAPGLGFPESLPDHDLVFVALSESVANRPLLKQIETHLQDWPRPLLNRPERIAWLTRDGACRLLQSTPGVVMPTTVQVARHTLEQIGRGERGLDSILEDAEFPIIVRPVDSHAGHSLVKADCPAAITEYLGTAAQSEFYVARFVDYRGEDGLFRKYRVVLIEGRPYACHMAISEHWMIHYLNAGMTESAAKRAEEAHFMSRFDEEFACRHCEALRIVNERMGLDYLGLDCAETPDGELLIFEVDASMIVHAMDPVDLFPYKQPQMLKVFAAFRGLLANAMRRGAS